MLPAYLVAEPRHLCHIYHFRTALPQCPNPEKTYNALEILSYNVVELDSYQSVNVMI